MRLNISILFGMTTYLIIGAVPNFAAAQDWGQILSGAGAVSRGMREAEMERMRSEQLRLQNEILRLEQERIRNQNLRLEEERIRNQNLRLEQERIRNQNLRLEQERIRNQNLRLEQERIDQQRSSVNVSQRFELSTLIKEHSFPGSSSSSCVYGTTSGMQFEAPHGGGCPLISYYDTINDQAYFNLSLSELEGQLASDNPSVSLCSYKSYKNERFSVEFNGSCPTLVLYDQSTNQTYPH